MKERILEYSKETFMHLGVRSVTMDALAVGLGISKKTIYQYFVDKEQLIMEVINSDMEDENNCLDEIANTYDNPIEVIIQISTVINNKLQSINPVLIHDLSKFHPQIWKKVMEHRKCRINERVYPLIVKGIEMELFRNDIAPKFMALFFYYAVTIIFNNKVFLKEDSISFTEMHQQVNDLLIYGMATEKGREAIEREKNKLLIK